MDLQKENTPSPPSPQDHEKGTIENFELDRLGYKQELRRNRSVLTLLFQTLAIAAIPYGEGSALLSAIYGGGPLSIFVGWIVVCVLDQCIAFSLAELASRYPTSAGPYYWTFQISRGNKTTLSFINAWIWLIGNWTITLSVNFGFASMLSATVSIYHPDWSASSWQLLLIFYAVCLTSLAICIFANKHLPLVDTLCASWTLLTIIIILIALSVKADTGRHSPSYTLSHYDKSFAGWGNFTFFIGLLPAAYTFSAIGMITSMAEECADPAVKVPRAISLSVPISSTPQQAKPSPYILARVMGSPAGGLGLISLVLVITVFCSISITVAASRATWAVARDDAVPLARMLLGLINLGSSSAFTAFVSVGVIALAAAYAIPIFLSLWHGREEVAKAPWTCGGIFGRFVNVVALAWIAFELVLFSMPTALPVTAVSMNYASVVFVGFMAISGVWYVVYARKYYKGPPESDALD
ncbi:hypothetical protein HAV15_012755 [Penicillium sp. str. |nr:hypothetical protein HAV15_012755 [Penicillium sp. str. \